MKGKQGPPKGVSNNPNGRPKGTVNERTKQWEELGKALLERHSERANQVLDNLEDDKFIDQYAKLLEYFKPKLARSEVKQENAPSVIRIIRDGVSYTPSDTPHQSEGDPSEPQAI